jgi:regulator of protease activity HflC (stomatin/prohibitin superfamily)
MFGAACTFLLLALVAFVLSRLVPAQKDGRKLDRASQTYRQVRPRLYFRVVGGGLFAFAALFGGLSCVATVSTKNLGVLTTFGHPDGYLQNGFHLKWPWQKVHEINDAIQTDTYADQSCISVRIARQSTACVNVSIRWQIKGEGVDYLFRNYKSNDHITDNLVLRDLQTALNEAFVGYDPLGIDDKGLSTNKPLSAAEGPSLANDILKHMQTNIGEWIDVYSVNIPIMTFDAATQDKINQLQQQVAATRVAEQAKLTAKAQAEANKALAQSVAKDPNVLIDKCLNILKEAVDKGQQLPAGFSCFGGSGTTAVAVPPRS